MTIYQEHIPPTLQRMWDEILATHTSVDLDTKDYKARIYRGIKVVHYGDEIKVYSTETPFYKDITDTFIEHGGSFKDCAHEYIKDRYLRNLDEVERKIKIEMNSSKNHKRFANLKARRTNLLNKYNEINSKETTAG
jgi:hypothetical protein